MEDKNRFRMTSVAKKISSNLFLSVSLLMTLGVTLFYNVLSDYFLILLLLNTSFLLGNKFHIDATIFESLFMKMAVGLGLIGLVIYYLLLLGVGSKSAYVLVLTIIIFVGIPKTSEEFDEIKCYVLEVKNIISRNRALTGFVLFFFSAYTMYGSAPISKYDALTKHLPITLYAVENGKWYTNVTESIVYGEPMVLQYTYSVLFASLGANKALVLFNVVLMFFVFIMLSYIARKIYRECNIWILAIILLTTPFFFEFATTFYLEILPLFFLFAAFVGCVERNDEKTWNNIQIISLLAGFSLFVKLTHVFTLCVMSIPLIVSCLKKVINEKQTKEGFFKAFQCIGLIILPSVTSLIYIFVQTGNPLFPSYNGIFKSPYFMPYNFEDPFKNQLSFSLKSLIDVVFYTTKNIEMGSFAFGIFLLFVFVVPIALLILYKKKLYTSFLVWTCLAVISYLTNTLTSYNLRYYSAVWVLWICIITVAISVCIDNIKPQFIRCIVYGGVAVLILIPNVKYIDNSSQFLLKIVRDDRLVNNEFCDPFYQIPEGKKILSVTNSNQFKGQYKGFFSSTTWHNCLIDRINAGEYSWEEYISSFDYVMLDKLCEDITVKKNLRKLVASMLGEKIFENDCCEVYAVNGIKNTIISSCFDTPEDANVLEPITEVINRNDNEYYITHTIVNEFEHNVQMRYQINWMSNSGDFLDTSIMIYEAEPGEHTYTSTKIERNKEADYGIVFVCSADETKIKVKSYSVQGFTNILEEEMRMYNNRERMK